MLYRLSLIPRLRHAGIAALLTVGCASLAAPLSAQSHSDQNVLIVSVIDDATHQPLVNAEVIIAGTQQSSFTNELGQVRLLRPADAAVNLRVRQIGFLFADRDVPRASNPAQRADTVVVALEPVSYKLPKVATKAVNSCGATTDPVSDALSALVLSQLRLSAERYDAFRRTYPFRVWIERRTVRRDFDGAMKADTVQVLGAESEKWGDPYVPGKVLSEEPNGRFSVPILFVSALADSVFWKHHCFVARGVVSLDGERVIQLDFSPTKETKSPDWEGTALVDSATSMLRRVDFDLTRLGNRDVLHGLMGFTIFRSPTVSISMPDSTTALWWRSTPVKDGFLQPADGMQQIRVVKLLYRNATPLGASPPAREEP